LALARRIAHLLGRGLFPRLGLDEGAAAAYESLLFYGFLVAIFLFALRTVDIPLTAFAVLGGALAIGFGFGSQNVVGNFISGLILLAERPIRRGDWIEVGGVYGNVERIGLRSTRVRTPDSIHVIVPNSSLLESNVVNWTLEDPVVRVKLSVGVAYGSPTREVARLVRQAVTEQAVILAQPEPVVLFREFGADALEFEARFWIRMARTVDRLRITSEVRFRIDELFREAQIVIAYPQRDVHLDTTSPLEVRVVDAEAGGPPSG
jgi:small-conductance mechanosensitive channel